GSHNFAADREMAAQVTASWPETPRVARANRAFLRRAVRYLVDVGVRQFIDLGSGIPTVGNVHEIAQARQPDARVVYVDTDPAARRAPGRIRRVRPGRARPGRPARVAPGRSARPGRELRAGAGARGSGAPPLTFRGGMLGWNARSTSRPGTAARSASPSPSCG